MGSACAVIVVSYESREHIGDCLASLRDGQDDPRVIVVDNASSDGTPQIVREQFPEVRLVSLDRNTGFATGVNRGIREASNASFFLLLNPDSVVLPGTIPRLVFFAKGRPEVGVVGPRVFDDPSCRTVQPSCRQFPTLMTGFFNRHSVLGRLLMGNRFSRSYLYLDAAASGPRPVDWVSGCAMLIRREVVERVGPFDEGYFFFCEDVDFCWRLHKAGWGVMYCPDAAVVHLSGKSAERIPRRILIEKHRSMLRLYRKHIRRTHLTDPLVVLGGAARLAGLLALASLRGWGGRARRDSASPAARAVVPRRE